MRRRTGLGPGPPGVRKLPDEPGAGRTAPLLPGWIINNNEHLAQVAVTGNYRLDKPLDVVRALAQITSAKVSEYPALVILN